MTTWEQFANEASELAALVRARFEAAETHVLATVRKDGSPRVSGSEVAFLGPHLTFGSMRNAVKARDLQRDGRCAIHAHPSDDARKEGDAKVAGIATEVTDSESPEDAHAFLLDLREAVVTAVEGEELVIRIWHPDRGVRTVRRK